MSASPSLSRFFSTWYLNKTTFDQLRRKGNRVRLPLFLASLIGHTYSWNIYILNYDFKLSSNKYTWICFVWVLYDKQPRALHHRNTQIFNLLSLSLSLSQFSLNSLSLSLSLPVSHSFTLLSLSLAFYPFIFVLFPFQTSNYVVGNVDSQGIARGAARTRLSLFQFHNFLFSLRLILHFFFS